MKRAVEAGGLAQEVEKFLSDNPQLKEALKLFEMSNEEYRKAIESTTQKPININSSSTDFYGDMARTR